MAGGGNMKVTGSNPTQYAQQNAGKEKLPMKDALEAMFPHLSFSDVKEPQAKTITPHNTPEGNHKTTQREEKVSFSLAAAKESIGKIWDKIANFFEGIFSKKVSAGGKQDLHDHIGKLVDQPANFLRLNNKFSTDVFQQLTSSVKPKETFESFRSQAENIGNKPSFDKFSLNTATKEQSQFLVALVKEQLSGCLTLGKDTFLSKLPENFKKSLSEAADQILHDDRLTREQQNNGVRLLYKSACFLRGTSQMITDHLIKNNLRQELPEIEFGNALSLKAMNGFSGSTFSKELKAEYQTLLNFVSENFDGAMMSIGMPDLRNR